MSWHLLWSIPAEWDAVNTDNLSDRARSDYEQAVTGFWNDNLGWRVYGISCEQASVDEIEAELTSGFNYDMHWVMHNGVDEFNADGTFSVDPTETLTIMKGSPTLQSPNWGCQAAGLGEQIFAGEFSDEFTDEFL